MKEYTSKSRCVACIQGGATLWSGEDDGSLVIRNGFTGEVSKVIKAGSARDGQTPDILVERIFPVMGHMFIGFNDGSIKVYDSLVVTLVQETTGNKGSPVTHFVQLNNNCIVAASDNGTITLFDDYNEEIAQSESIYFKEIRTRSIGNSITALAASMNDVVAGTAQGEVLEIDTTDLGIYNRFNINDKSGDVGVGALQRANGLLFVATTNGVVQVYKLNDRTKDKLPHL